MCLVFWLLVVSSFNYFKMHAWSTSMLLLLHSAFTLSMVNLLLKGEVEVCALNSHGNYIVDHGKSWKNHGIVFLNFCGNPDIELIELRGLYCDMYQIKTWTYPCSSMGESDFRILRLTFNRKSLTFHRKSASKCWIKQILKASLIYFQYVLRRLII